VCDSTVSKYK